MKLLALEAGGPVLSAALFEDGRAVGRSWTRAPLRPTERLAPLVEALLRERAWKPSHLDALACGRGPGSFTGLRSSMAFGAGLGLAVEGLRLVAVPTLAAWAEAFCPRDRSRALVLLDGRRGQAYRGLLRREGEGWADALKPALVDLSVALEESGKDGEAAALIGDLEALSALPAATERDSAALALAVGRLGCLALKSGAELPPWQPDYLRRSEAELLWERLHPAPASPPTGRGGLNPMEGRDAAFPAPLELGPLRFEDLDEVCAIERASFPTPWSRSLFEEELRRPGLCFWLALRDPSAPEGSRLAAYAGFWKAVDEAHLTNVAVHPGRRRLGLGRGLLRALLGQAKSVGCVRATLEVRPSNAAALALYESEGFSPAALRPRYYSDDDEDALILWKHTL